MADMIGGGRPMRPCIACGQVDDHPRCSDQLPDGSWIDFHHDCHRIAKGELPCHPHLAGGAAPGPGADMLTAILDHHAENGA